MYLILVAFPAFDKGAGGEIPRFPAKRPPRDCMRGGLCIIMRNHTGKNGAARAGRNASRRPLRERMERIVKKRICAVLFDMDGLMFDTERLSDELWRAVSRRHGVPMTPQDVALLRGRNRESGRAAMRERFGADFPYEAIVGEVRREEAERLSRQVPLRPGLPELLEALRRGGYPMAVASSTDSAAVLRNLETAGVRPYFSAVIGGDHVTRSKPDPQIFQMAAQALDTPPAQCMVLEDSYNGVRAGAAAGCFTVMVPDMDPPTPEMERLAAAIVPDLTRVIPLLDLPRPD